MALAGRYEYWRDPDIDHDDDPTAWLISARVVTVANKSGVHRRCTHPTGSSTRRNRPPTPGT
ncbi:hypothetical protein [Streptomyces sp. NPDC005525]|uniref:hypothetical protein n=1 Tax=Streptomyces sp. NPDC005525 TaxID=3364720 RepID=UPI0036A55DF5